MECACVYVEDCYDALEFFSKTMRRARKEHKCCECRRMILPAEEYEHVSGKWEGQVETYKTCQDCLSIRREFFCEGFFYEQMFEYLHEHLNEIYGQVSSDCLLALTPAAMTKVCGMIDRLWEDNWDDTEDADENP